MIQFDALMHNLIVFIIDPEISIHLMKLYKSFFVGCIGSAAYITTLRFNFVGENSNYRQVILQPFQKNGSILWRNCIWYCFIGGIIATIFQYDVPNFVAVQSLILGATWPAIVSQFLSGRMVSPSASEVEKIVTDDIDKNQKVKKMIKDIADKLDKPKKK